MLFVCSSQCNAQETLKPRKEPGARGMPQPAGGLSGSLQSFLLPPQSSLSLVSGCTCIDRTALTIGGKRQESGMARPVQLSCRSCVAGSEAPKAQDPCGQGGAVLPGHWAVIVTVTLLCNQAACGIFVTQLLLNNSAALEKLGNAKCWRSPINVW